MTSSKLCVAVLAVCVVACSSTTTWRNGTMSLVYSATLPGNLLPAYLFLQGAEEGGSTSVPIGGGRGSAQPFVPTDMCPDDIWMNAMPDLRSPQLPYLTQDLWTCDRTPDTRVDGVVYESESLRAFITPQWGGKIWSLYDKANDEEMVYNNPAAQPANIGALKAWKAGGIEWNYSPGIIGHSAFTESPVFMGTVDTPMGSVLRVYEFDRYNATVWQVDMLMINDTLYVHPTITNPQPTDQHGYWWTCVAHHVTPESRVVTPATYTVETSSGSIRPGVWPGFAQSLNTSFHGVNDSWRMDKSYLGNLQNTGDYFVRIPRPHTPYIMHVDTRGYGVAHGHTLNGTKLFSWGQNGPGRFMQDFLSANAPDRAGDYAELQIGPAPTQMQTFPLPAQSTLSWTEWYQPMRDERLRATDYAEALACVDEWMAEAKPRVEVDRVNAFLAKHSTVPLTTMLYTGSSWGGLHERLTGQSLCAGCEFTVDDDAPEVRMWVELLRDGRFSPETLADPIPRSYQVRDEWAQLLQRTMTTTTEATWLHYYLLGVINTERGAIVLPRQQFESSLRLLPTAVCERSIAVLCTDPRDAYTHFMNAWKLALAIPPANTAREQLLMNLATEIAFFLHSSQWYVELDAFVTGAPACVRGLDAMITSTIKVALRVHNDTATAIGLLAAECFPTYASDRPDLVGMWNEAHVLAASIRVGRPLTMVEERNVRVANPVPRNIGCQYGGSFCQYW